MLTLTHVRLGVKEPIPCIETLDGVSPIRQSIHLALIKPTGVKAFALGQQIVEG
jgi:hypothetical protein